MLTFLGGNFGLLFPLPANGPLLLLQPNLLYIGLVPLSDLHQPLVGPQTTVRRGHVVLHLVQLACKLRKVVHLLVLGAAERIRHRDKPTTDEEGEKKNMRYPGMLRFHRVLGVVVSSSGLPLTEP